MPDDTLEQFNQARRTLAQLGQAVELQESGGRNDAVSPKGALGPMQVMPATAAKPGLGVAPFDPTDPEQNRAGGRAYLNALVAHYGGDTQKALAAYNAGIGTVDKGGPLPEETQKYVPAVEGRMNQPDDILAQFNAARRHLATPPVEATPVAPVEAPPEQPSPLRRFARGVWENLNPIEAAKGAAQAVMHPVDTFHGIVNAAGEQFGKAQEDYNQGHYSEMIGHGLAGAIPIVGPAAAKAGEAIGGGDIAGGLGQGAGLIGSIVAPEAVGKVVKGTGTVLSKGAERIIKSNVKPDKALIKGNPTVNIPRTILDEGFGPGQRGFNKASGVVEDLSNHLSQVVADAAAKTGKVDLQPVLDHLDALEESFKHQPNPTADLSAVRQAREAILNNPLYSKDKMGPGPDIAQTIQVPEQTPLGGTVYRNKTVMQPGPDVVVGRQLTPQALPEIDVMKKNVYQGLKGKYGKEGTGVIETDKAMGRGLKDILNDNVPEAKAINARQSKVIVARNALQDMAIRNGKKFPLGLMDLVGMGAGATGAGALGPAGAIPAAIALLLKHPTAAFPIARMIDTAGKTTRGLAPLATGATATGVAGQQTRRPVKLDEATEIQALLK